MFIGHYGVALAAKPVQKQIPLWLLFIAVQWLDVVWSVLVMLGVEKLRIVKGFTEANSMDLYYMPYTHGLIGALALSAALGGLTILFLRDRRVAVFSIVAGAVFSHWLLDLVVHVEDLPLIGNSMKVGFGLWRHVWLSLPLELATLMLGAIIYARAMPSQSRTGIWAYWIFIGFLLLAQLYTQFGPDPTSPIAEAQTALAAYVGLAVVAGIVDGLRARTVRARSNSVAVRPL